MKEGEAVRLPLSLADFSLDECAVRFRAPHTRDF
jgi:hypothetical protein